jgi:hypothetical protein
MTVNKEEHLEANPVQRSVTVSSQPPTTSGYRATVRAPTPPVRVTYGLDAPLVVAGFVAAGLLGVVFLVLTALTGARLLGPGIGFTVFGWTTAALMLHSSPCPGRAPCHRRRQRIGAGVCRPSTGSPPSQQMTPG